MNKSYFRPAVDAMAGYTPGEQPKVANLIKINTNENPYPPSPAVAEALSRTDPDTLRLYPDPTADRLRDAAGEVWGFERDRIVAANGSDDVLTMVFRAFTDRERPVAILDPTYSLYPALAAIQEAPVIRIPLDAAAGFALPAASRVLELAAGANLLIITRPNAPTGNTFELQEMRRIATGFDGIVLFDEAYAEFASDNCLGLAREFPNVLVSRTLSKSYSLAGLRVGFVMGHPVLAEGLMKLKDSYNLDRLSQIAAEAALRDRAYLALTRERILATRKRLADGLTELGCRVIPSETNFVFAAPPDGDGRGWFEDLRREAVITRYFPGEVTGAYLRISVGTDGEIDRLLEITRRRGAKSMKSI